MNRILIIDGNNLAHEIFALRKSSKVTAEHAQRLADLLCDYLRANPAQRLQVELYYDGYLEPTLDFSTKPWVSLRVIPTHEADDEIIQRVFECARDGDDAVVATADEDLRQGIEDLGGVTVSAFEFILVHNPKLPRFIYPGNLPFKSRVDTTLLPQEPLVSLDEFDPAEPPPEMIIEWSESLEEEPEHEFPGLPPAPAAPESVDTPTLAEPVPAEEPLKPAAPPPAPEAWYRVDPVSWPLEEGARFLLDSFCAVHRSGAADLLPKDQPIRPADLQALAALLVASCAAEPDFCLRGSLMDRVRLALLQAEGAWLPIDELARRTGLNPVGLQGKVKKKAEKWLEIQKGDS